MKKRTASLIIILTMIVLLLSSCGAQEIPAGMDEDAILEKAEEIAELLGKGETAEIYELLRDDVAATLTEDDVKSIVPDSGEWVGVVSGVVIGATDENTGEEYAKAVLVCKFQKERITINVALDKNMELIGLRVDG